MNFTLLIQISSFNKIKTQFSPSPHLPKLHHIQHREHHPIHRTVPTLMEVSVEPMRQGVSIVAQTMIQGIHRGTLGLHVVQQRGIRSGKLH